MDAKAIQRLGAEGGSTLMARAGRSAFELLLQRWPACHRLQVLCGGGNNGGDGYVVARLAHERGLDVQVWSVVDPKRLQGDAALAWRAADEAGVAISDWNSQCSLDADVVVDALLGIGLAGEVRSPYRELIEALNQSRVPVLAIDIPSGLCALTGRSLGIAVRADATLSFIALKSGLVTGEANAHSGYLWLDDLACEGEVSQFQPQGDVYTFDSVSSRFPHRTADAHKGHFGRILVVGGDYGLGGAAILAAGSALRAGAGSVTCATRDAHVQPGLSCFPDIMFRSTEHHSVLVGLIASADVIAIGPGLGRSPWGEMSLRTVLDSGKPLVMDADALNLLALSGWRNPENVPLVLTPHPGEAARLLDQSTEQVNADRYASARALADRYRGVCLLKGAGTVIAEAGRASVHVLRGGNPGMATAGMGDVLTGIIAGLLGQGVSITDAACLGAAWHAASADRCVARQGEASLMASDVLQALGLTRSRSDVSLRLLAPVQGACCAD